ncbi:hypothetical protein EC973_001712 [Apophysomyces ossiformis]|uniref:Uncharacterized protein n=1 Tax=Apophysomyces ossiformis TaxID=679940 RepID=A0A8H7BJC4_9FUNG|nr:hypothetical protein EC973_001712 [Apophysomyces ossiformis]
MMGYVLDDVFQANNIGVVMLLSRNRPEKEKQESFCGDLIFNNIVVLVLLGAYETVFNRSKKTFKGLFFLMFVILFVSNFLIGLVGAAFVLQEKPFWTPTKFIPIIGMLLGNSMGSVAMATERCLDQFSVHAPLLETRLAYGATRYEAGLPLAIDAIRIALLPVITQLSVMGMINIPGMMTGQIMAGTPMMQAVIYQECIMFMVAASSALGVVMVVVSCLVVLIDEHQTLRSDKIENNQNVVQRILTSKFALKPRDHIKYEEVELR